MTSAERSSSVTLTTQSAVSLGLSEDFCPSLVISIDFSSMKSEGPKVTLEFGEECSEDVEFEARLMK